MIITFCATNFGAAGICQELKSEFPYQVLKLKQCLENCATCNRAPFAIIDDREKISAGRWDDVKATLRELIENG